MAWMRTALRALDTGRRTAASMVDRAEHMLHMLRVVQMLLIAALVVLVATVVVGLAQPAWLPYTTAVGSVILAIPLVAILILLWAPLHSRPARIVHRLAGGH